MSAASSNFNMSTSRSIAWGMWLIASIFYCYQYILRVMPSIMMQDIVQQFDIDIATFGQFSGVYYIGYALMHLPIGIMLDRFGPKKVMPICSLMTVIGLLPIMFSDYWLYPIIGRILIGMGSSAAILGTFKIIRIAFAEEKFTRMLSFSVTIGLIGAIYGGGPVNYMCGVFSYKIVTGIFACIGIVLSIVTYIIVPNITPKPSSILVDVKEIFSNKKVLAICCLAGLMVGPLEGFADVWGSGFLQQVYGFKAAVAVSLPSAIFIGMCFGSPVLSLIAEKTNNYIATIIGAGSLMAISFILLLTGNLTSSFMSIMFIAVGVCSAYQIVAIYKASTYVRENLVGLTTAVANMIIMIFGYLFHSIIGFVINSINVTSDTNPLAYTYGIAVIPCALIIGIIGFTVIYLREYKQRYNSYQVSYTNVVSK